MSTLRQAAQQALEALEYIHTETSAYEDELIHAAITNLRAALAEPEQEPLSLNNGRLTQYPDGSIGVGTPAEPEQSVAVKQMLRWVEHLKRLSDDGQHMSIPGLSSGACWELAIELEQFIKNTAPTPQSKPQTTHWEGCEAVHPECRKPEQEPVAWLITDEKINSLQVASIQRLIDRTKHAHYTDVLLRINGTDERYEADWLKHMTRTAPTPRKPLTDDQIVDIWAGVSMDYDDEISIIELARALERAHGIGEQHD